ncbi:2Fe-2S ferredoxin-like [Benincasa hispida]|uniref:2Fe-2S ferredoxin-like n=1 Tax=Benincasa hispida TaxID=102211 RepID=UPI0018FF2E37|nr:2Fe-2S ferredoxin-like [Benincasa hispida]XP_038900027.1 2Fe-2S ferredoxin-like [Benincasa hispida]
MSLFKLSRSGVRMIKELFRGQSLLVTKASHIRGPFFKYLQTLPQAQVQVLQSFKWQEQRLYSTSGPQDGCNEENEPKETISVTFVLKDGEEQQIRVPVGMSMLEAAHLNDIELEGACEGSLACSTCHVIVMDMEYYNKLEEPVDEENDMLDLAFGLTETSRLGCQVIAKPELDGIRLAIPAATRNFAVDGFTPKPH